MRSVVQIPIRIDGDGGFVADGVFGVLLTVIRIDALGSARQPDRFVPFEGRVTQRHVVLIVGNTVVIVIIVYVVALAVAVGIIVATVGHAVTIHVRVEVIGNTITVGIALAVIVGVVVLVRPPDRATRQDQQRRGNDDYEPLAPETRFFAPGNQHLAPVISTGA